MKKVTRSAQIAMQAISNGIERLHGLLIGCQSDGIETAILLDRLKLIDGSNSEFSDYLGDLLENFKMMLYMLALPAICCIDYLLFSNAISIMCEQLSFGWQGLVKLAVPFFLTCIEVIVSYVCILKTRSGEWSSWFSKILQFFIFGILFGFCILACVFIISGYNADSDGSFLIFIISTIAYHAALLISSVILHIWLIHNSENIVVGCAYMKYRYDRQKIAAKGKSAQKSTVRKQNDFKQQACKLVKDMEVFYRLHPDIEVDFTSYMPEELINAINQVMGRMAIVPGRMGNKTNNMRPQNGINKQIQ